MIIWKAASGVKVVLSGGRPVTGIWTKGENGIWHTDLTGIGLGPEKWNFRQLFVNGRRATKARFPNVSQANPFIYATGGGMDHVLIAPALIKESWGKVIADSVAFMKVEEKPAPPQSKSK